MAEEGEEQALGFGFDAAEDTRGLAVAGMRRRVTSMSNVALAAAKYTALHQAQEHEACTLLYFAGPYCEVRRGALPSYWLPPTPPRPTPR